MKTKNNFIFLVIFSLLLLSACSQKKEDTQEYVQTPVDNFYIEPASSGLDECGTERHVLINGYISELYEDYMVVISPGEKESKIKLAKETVFLKMYLNKEEILVKQENILKEDIEEGQGVAVEGVWEKSCKDDEYKALIVKQIILIKTE